MESGLFWFPLVSGVRILEGQTGQETLLTERFDRRLFKRLDQYRTASRGTDRCDGCSIGSHPSDTHVIMTYIIRAARPCASLSANYVQVRARGESGQGESRSGQGGSRSGGEGARSARVERNWVFQWN